MGNFRFKQFEIEQDRCAMKVGTDGVLLGAWAQGGRRILDIGSGTGLISLMMAQRFPEAEVVGIDMDADACGQARENVMASPFRDRVEIECCRLQDFGGASEAAEASGTAEVLKADGGASETAEGLKAAGVFDAIVSNPPFFVDSLKNPDSKRTMARHTDSLPFRDLFAGVKRLLSDDGVFSAIVPVEVVELFVAESCILGFYLIRKCGVKTVERKQPKRFMLSFAKHRISPYEEHVETMMDSQGNRSEWYRKITEEFYLF
uniref:tRNA1(Val) (adenine(37)-N6)-methyltransferase n=1 Tax=Prevotella sp. TaxID=59823 RepID=UPI003FEE137C